MFSYIRKRSNAVNEMTTPHKTLTKTTNKQQQEMNKDDMSNEECFTTPVFGQQYSNTVQDNVAMHIDSDGEDEMDTVDIKNNYFSAPHYGEDDSEMTEIDHSDDEDSAMTDNQATIVNDDCKCDDEEEIMSYDQITAMLGEDTSTSDHLVNLFDEERRVNASQWFTMTTYTRRVKAYRTNQIEWIRATCVALGLLDSTAFRAIYYFDKVCAVKMVNRKHLSIMAACCLNIAAKFNDKDKYTPTIEEVADACQYSVESLVGSELQIMRALKFKLKIVLPLDFIQYYVAQKRAIFADDELRNHDEIENITENKKVLGDVEKFAVFFLHIAMESYSFYQFKSSIIALAVLCAARRAMQIKPFNHSELGMVGDNEESKQVNACFDRLWSKYHFKFPANAKTYSQYQPKDKK